MPTWYAPIGVADAELLTAGQFVDRDGQTPLRIWSTPERCEGWRWPARMMLLEPAPGRTQYWSPNVGEASALTVLGIEDGMPLWGPGGRQVITFARRAAGLTDDQAVAAARAWLQIPIPARRSTAKALKQTVELSGRTGASVAARAFIVDEFNSQERHLGRRVAEPVHSALRAAASALIVRDKVQGAQTGLSDKGFQLLVSPWQN